MRAIPVIAALLAATVACGGSPTSPTPPFLTQVLTETLPPEVLTRGVLRATVDGVPREAASPVGSLSSGVVGITVVATIVGLLADAETVVSVTVPVAVGAYALGGPAYLNFALLPAFGRNPTALWIATPFTSGSSGTATVTMASTTRVAGTFSFTGVAPQTGASPTTRVVSDGVFDLAR